MNKILLKPGREKSLLRYHPWIFSGAIDHIEGTPEIGSDIDICDINGKWLARGSWSPNSQIRSRVWTFTSNETINQDFFKNRLTAALNYRKQLGVTSEDSYRLVHGEADSLPALIVDKYGDFLSCQFSSAGTEFHKSEIINALREILPGIKGIYERSDCESREREGLSESTGPLCGDLPPADLTIKENGLVMAVNLTAGHKTGYYLDQRENRRSVISLSPNAEVLDCCCYAGGFGLLAAKSGAASVTFADAADSSLELVRKNADANNISTDNLEFIRGDVFQLLRKFRDARRSFDLIILDPPKFASTQARLAKASKGYKDINLLAIKLLKKGGTLLTYSCSAAMTPEFFRTIIAQAAIDSGRRLRIVKSFAQGADHPQSPFFPEGYYLTGLQICAD